MEKNKKKLLSILTAFLMVVALWGQSKSGMENYHQMGEGQDYLWIPMLHYSSAKGYYAELRYNYEDASTFSVFAGKSFQTGKGKITGTMIPMIGYSAGNFRGLSIALNTELNWEKVFFSSQMQYSHALRATDKNFYFNWSEAGYSMSDRFYAGFALQYTFEDKAGNCEPGIVAGLNAGAFTFPVYIFRPFGKRQVLMAGLSYEFQLRSRKKIKSLSL